MRHRSVLAMVFSGTLCGCGGGTQDVSGAAAAFATFQDALRRGDEAACRGALTIESQAAMAEVSWADVRAKKPLTVVGVDGAGAEFRVRVLDPNDGDRSAEFVVVREYGRFVVDLVASAGLTAQVVEASAAGSRQEYEPRELTPADHDRIRLHELSQPPR